MRPDQWARWGVLIMAVVDGGRPDEEIASGHCLDEWLRLTAYDYDWIDREFYLDSIGG